MTIKFYKSPFHAIEEPEMANHCLLKADLMIMIRDIIESKGLTLAETAKQLAVSQIQVSDIINGKIDQLTLDTLFSMLDKLEFRVEFTFDSLEEASIKIHSQKIVTAV